ncbi:hypothetical protein [Nocardia huaxiensis]|uniref:Uncharacterized protein n=1 Tax=Nocardia huaxiensis TaxID=2755382 RepID=A0A7D6ZFV1_9NOCA|nr:hypothetical protein [Nocardia huaxiensis]QLY32658.1 hypothetical protein H0264_10725 [Nocardia huaxiensis]UFS93609.1 hypothetical protein LPY97_22650 [Nocardia huaxiensis]
MKKIAAALAISAAALTGIATNAGIASAEELIGENSYGSPEACIADNNNGTYIGPNGIEINAAGGWTYDCLQHNDGKWYLHFYR